MKRTLKPRPPQALAAEFVSQDSAPAVLGVDARRFLERIVPLCKGHVVELGKLRLVPVRVAVERLSALAASTPETIDDLNDDEQPQSANDVLRALGKRVAS